MESLTQDVKIQISNNIKLLLMSEKKTRRQVCADLGFKYTTFCDWTNGNTTPNYRVLEQLGEYFQVEPWWFYEDADEFKKKRAGVLVEYASRLKDKTTSESDMLTSDIIKGRKEIITLVRWLRDSGRDDDLEKLLQGDNVFIDSLLAEYNSNI